MCVIVAKPSGVKMPTTDAITDMWFANPDGAGLMYAHKGTVFIRKGFMDLADFLTEVENLETKFDLTKLPLVMHFRITTHGGTKPENCHPFPISDSVGVLSKLDSRTSLGVAHNGIIPITPRKGISDTMEYVISQLAPLHRAVPDFYKSKDLMQMVYNAVSSKLAFLTDKGEIFTVGDFQTEDGILYSNLNHKWMRPRDFRFGCYDGWDKWDGFDDMLYSESGETLGSFVNRTVMWIDDDLGYVSGVEDPEDIYGMYAIDKDNNLYEYNVNVDALVKVPGAVAYSNTGTTIRFNKRSASTMTELIFEPFTNKKKKSN